MRRVLAIQQVSGTRQSMPRPLLNGALIVRLLLSTDWMNRPNWLYGVDLKYDNCNYPSEWDDEYNACIPDSDYPGVNPNGTCPGLTNPAPAGYDWSTSNTTKRFNIMRDALVAVQDQRVILYSLCEWGYADVPSWGNGTGNSWRVTGDINGMSWSCPKVGTRDN